jgi:hypothetical protein
MADLTRYLVGYSGSLEDFTGSENYRLRQKEIQTKQSREHRKELKRRIVWKRDSLGRLVQEHDDLL